VEELGKHARVFISSEGPLPEEFEKYRIKLPAVKMLDLLYYATMYIGEGATMASECAVLGTPAIYFSSLRLGYLEEQEQRYGLVYNYQDTDLQQERVVEKALDLLQRENLKEEWRAKKDRLLSEKIDVTRFVMDFIEHYPRSFQQYKDRIRGEQVSSQMTRCI
jgi:predicted glycosyltransferase